MKRHYFPGLIFSLLLISFLFWQGCSEDDSATSPTGPLSISWYVKPPNFERSQTDFHLISAHVTGASSYAVNRVEGQIEDDAGNLITTFQLYDDANAFEHDDALDFCSPYSGDLVANNNIFSRLMNGQFAPDDGTYTITLKVFVDGSSATSPDSSIIVAASTPPVLSELFFPDTLQSPIQPVQIHVDAVDGDFAINDSVIAVTMKMYTSGGAELDTFSLARITLGTYGMDLEADFTAGHATGDYRFDFYAYDTFGLVSDPADATSHLINEAPDLSEIVLPDTIELPDPGFQVIFALSVKCWDDQTVEDIAQVYIQTTKPDGSSGSPVDLYDDGDFENSGDEVAGDSVYTRIVALSSSDQAGNYVFHFRGLDKAGNESEISEGLWVEP